MSDAKSKDEELFNQCQEIIRLEKQDHLLVGFIASVIATLFLVVVIILSYDRGAQRQAETDCHALGYRFGHSESAFQPAWCKNTIEPGAVQISKGESK